MTQFDLKNAVIKIKDGTAPTPNEITVKIGEGTMTFSEKRPLMYKKNRGRLDDVVTADEEPVEVSIDAVWDYIKASSGATPTIIDALKKRGEAASWVSSDVNTCRPYAVDIEVTYTPICDDEDIGTITLSDFRYEDISHNLKEGQFSITGKCNITEPTIVRTAQ